MFFNIGMTLFLQLRLIMEEGLAFEGFHEGELNFPPTYKFNAGTDSYDTR